MNVGQTNFSRVGSAELAFTLGAAGSGPRVFTQGSRLGMVEDDLCRLTPEQLNVQHQQLLNQFSSIF